MRDIRVRAGATECSIKHPPCCPSARVAAPPRSGFGPLMPSALAPRNIRGAIKTQNFGARHAPGILRPAPLSISRRCRVKRERKAEKGVKERQLRASTSGARFCERLRKSTLENRDGVGLRAYAAKSFTIIISVRIKLVMEPIISPRLPVSFVEFHSWRCLMRPDLNYIRIKT